MPLGIAVIGLGRWGPNHLRNFSAHRDCIVLAAADPSTASRERVAQSYRTVQLYADYREVLARSDIDAVVVSSPTATHAEIVRAALQAGKHVLCEKPLTNSSADAWPLVAMARERKRVLMVGHVFLYNAGIEYLVKAARRQEAGSPFYMDAVRTNLGPFRSDVNAAWDLASHDIYIFNYVLGERPTWVSAVGASFLRKPVEDIVFLTLQYPSGVLGHIHVSWLDPKKLRMITLVGENKMITWDEFGVPGPIMIYDRSVVKDPVYTTYGEFQLLTREGDVVLPRIQLHEPLVAQTKAFVERCRAGADGEDDRGTARQGAEVVDVLEAAAASLRDNNRRVEVKYGG